MWKIISSYIAPSLYVYENQDKTYDGENDCNQHANPMKLKENEICLSRDVKQNIETETKWPTFCRRHFQTYFTEWKYSNFDSNIIEICF